METFEFIEHYSILRIWQIFSQQTSRNTLALTLYKKRQSRKTFVAFKIIRKVGTEYRNLKKYCGALHLA
ncbi:MAG: hypothetical protein DRJ05_09365 [Bacteroidetes bacterium]|nr:MAG: hypothetical protein DRJ05_09365 [Bacteroidota bacterium]